MKFPVFRLVATLALVALLAAVFARGQSTQFEVLIRNGRIVDGTGAPWFRGDVGITGDHAALLCGGICANEELDL